MARNAPSREPVSRSAYWQCALVKASSSRRSGVAGMEWASAYRSKISGTKGDIPETGFTDEWFTLGPFADTAKDNLASNGSQGNAAIGNAAIDLFSGVGYGKARQGKYSALKGLPGLWQS